MKLVQNKPVGTRQVVAHVNYGQKRGCEWKELPWPKYSEADVARGRRFREARRHASVSILEIAKRLNVTPSTISALELGWARPADEAEEALFFDALVPR